MKKIILNFIIIGLAAIAFTVAPAQEINIQSEINVLGQTKPIPIALSGFTGVGAEVLKFDLTVQGFSFVAPDAAQYLISGSDAAGISGTRGGAGGARDGLRRTLAHRLLRVVRGGAAGQVQWSRPWRARGELPKDLRGESPCAGARQPPWAWRAASAASSRASWP